MTFRSRRLGFVLLLLGCGPKIQEFQVEPRRICQGDTVRVTFKTRGTPRLVVVRRGGPLADTTSYTIVAESHGKQAYSVMDVVTFLPGATPPLAFTTEVLGTDSLSARDSIPAETWGDVLRIGEIASESGRALVVGHGGKQEVVGPAGTSAWRGLPVNGTWVIRAGLLRGERVGDPAHHPPARLYLKMSLVCRTAGAP